MVKYHISDKTGKPEKCRADVKKCPIINNSEHYDSLEKANIAAEEKFNSANGILSSKTSKKEIKAIDNEEQVLEDKMNFSISMIDKIMDREYGYPVEEDIISVADELYDHRGTSKTYSELFDSIDNLYWDNSEPIALQKMYPHVIDLKKIIAREDNLANVSPDSHWSNHMKSDIARRIAANKEYIIPGKDSYYGSSYWKPGEDHGKLIGIFNVKENSWQNFEGTFYEGNETKIGFEAELFFEDGYSMIGRMEGGFGEMINDITKS